MGLFGANCLKYPSGGWGGQSYSYAKRGNLTNPQGHGRRNEEALAEDRHDGIMDETRISYFRFRISIWSMQCSVRSTRVPST